jgi:short-subunit dehydrogenase
MSSRGVAVVTGASAGIGEAFARRLSRDGFRVVLVGRRAERLNALAAELGGEALRADLTVEADVHAVEERIAHEPALAMLVNNAGFGLSGRFYESSINDHERMHKLHVMAPLRLTHAALKNMVPRNTGSVINVASVAGFRASPGSVSYAATKAWMNIFTEGLWLDLRNTGSSVRVQALCPGFTYSEFHDVMGMDRTAIPKSWWYTADFVVDTSLKALEQDNPYVIPGWRYRALVRGMNLVPGSLVRSGAIWFSRKFRKPLKPAQS